MACSFRGGGAGCGRCVACHEHGTTLRGFLPRGWDHLVASDGTTRRVVPVVLSLSCSDAAKSSDLEAGADGVPGGQRDRAPAARNGAGARLSSSTGSAQLPERV